MKRSVAHDPDSVPRASVSLVAPGLFRFDLPWRPARIGHCQDMTNPREPIYWNGQEIEPGSAALLDLDCTGCDSRTLVSPTTLFTWLVVEHRNGCPRFSRLLAGSRP
jgi:hypothetical protein